MGWRGRERTAFTIKPQGYCRQGSRWDILVIEAGRSWAGCTSWAARWTLAGSLTAMGGSTAWEAAGTAAEPEDLGRAAMGPEAMV